MRVRKLIFKRKVMSVGFAEIVFRMTFCDSICLLASLFVCLISKFFSPCTVYDFAAKLFNSLPRNIKQGTDIPEFKRKCRSH